MKLCSKTCVLQNLDCVVILPRSFLELSFESVAQHQAPRHELLVEDGDELPRFCQFVLRRGLALFLGFGAADGGNESGAVD